MRNSQKKELIVFRSADIRNYRLWCEGAKLVWDVSRAARGVYKLFPVFLEFVLTQPGLGGLGFAWNLGTSLWAYYEAVFAIVQFYYGNRTEIHGIFRGLTSRLSRPKRRRGLYAHRFDRQLM